MSEVDQEKQRTWALGTKDSREAIREQLDEAGLSSDTKAINLDDVATLIAQRTSAAEAALSAPTPDEIMMQTFVASGLDPSMLETWRATAAEQQIPFTQFVMGHIVKAQQSGELNAPARDQGWAMAPAGSGGAMIQTLEYACQNPSCTVQESGRLGQLYCSNACAAAHKRFLANETTQRARQSRLQRLRGSLYEILGIGGAQGHASDEDMHAVEQLLTSQGPITQTDPVVERELAALGAVGVEVDMATAEATSQAGRELVTLNG